MSDAHCAICRMKIDLSSMHVDVGAETIAGPPESESYLFHLSCWNSVSEGWGPPA